MAFSPQEKRRHVGELFAAAVAAVEPYAAVRRVLARDRDTLLAGREQTAFRLNGFERVWVAGCGKAGAPMAAAAGDILGDRLSGGVVVVKHGHATHDRPRMVEILEAGHPVPDTAGMDGSRRALDLLRRASKNDLVIALVSGGGSALWTLPAAHLSLDDKIAVSRTLLGCGADIGRMNAVRKHLSAIKGGQAARAAAPAQVIVLVVSDVVGDHLDVIASGPFAPDRSTFKDAWGVVCRYGLQDSLPPAVLRYLQSGLDGTVPETPKAADPYFCRVHHVLCAANAQALQAAADKARELGYHAAVIDSPLCGESRDAGRRLAEEAFARAAKGPGRPQCLVAGGETTVTLGSTFGRGGRNQELALSAAFALDGRKDILLASLGTDGTDGPTDAAGAIADGTTISRAFHAGLDPRIALDGHDAYPFFEKLGDLIRTGPTKTNVMDLQVVLF